MGRRLVTILLAWFVSALSPAGPALAALRPGDIVVNESTINGEMVKVDPVTGAVSHLSLGGLIRSNQSQMAQDVLGRILTYAAAGLVAVDPDTGAQALLAPPIPSLSIQAVAVAPTGEVYATSSGYPNLPPSIFRFDTTTGAYSTVSSGGSLVLPAGITMDADGSLLVADAKAFGGMGGILRIDPSSGVQTTVASGGSIVRPNGILVEPGGMIVITVTDPHHFFCFDPNCAAVLRIDPADGSQSVIASGAPMRNPYAIAWEADGYLLVVEDYFNDRIGNQLIRIDSVTGAQTVLSTRFAGVQSVLVVPGNPVPPDPTCGDSRVNQPTEQCDVSDKGVCPGPCNPDCTCFQGLLPGDIVVLDLVYGALIRIDRSTGDRTVLSASDIGTGPAFLNPQGMTIESNGSILVADAWAAALFEVDPLTGDRVIVSADPYQGSPGTTSFAAMDAAIDASGNLYATEFFGPSLRRIDPSTGTRTLVSATSGPGSGPDLTYPDGLIAESDGRLLTALANNKAILRIDPATGNRTFLSRAPSVGSGPAFNGLQSLCLEGESGVLVLDSGVGYYRGGTMFRVDRATGNRTIVSGCTNPFTNPCPLIGAGPLFIYPRGVATEPGGTALVGDIFEDLLIRVDTASGDCTVISSVLIGQGPELLGPWDLEIVPADLDTDADGLPDDGDGSGTVGDHPCASGENTGCDDNCRFAANAGQNDFDTDAQGDACDADDDDDGLADAVETGTGVFVSASDTGTSSLNVDSDGDGFPDGAEVAAGSDPNDPGSVPQGGAIPTLGTTGALVFALALLVAGGRALRRNPAARSERDRAEGST